MDADPSSSWLRAGHELSAEQADELLKRLGADPNDFEARVKLLGYAQWSSRGEAVESELFRDQLLWCIENQPSADLHTSGSLHPDSSPSLSAEVCALWRAAIARDPDSLSVLRNAGLGFFCAGEFELARAAFEELERREPQNPAWPTWTARCFAWRSENAQDSALALTAFERALALEQPRQAYTLRQAAESALRCARNDRARELALELLDAARAREFGRLRGSAHFHGHRILGLLALSEGDLAQAERELVESVRDVGSSSPVKKCFERGSRPVASDLGARPELNQWIQRGSRDDEPAQSGRLLHRMTFSTGC